MAKILDTINSWFTNLLQNQWVTAIIALFLILYASMARPELPDSVARLFENPFFRLFVLFCIAYAASKNVTIAVVVAVAFAVVMSMLSEMRLREGFSSGFK